ncbi:MAG: hypothetical protein IKP95_04715 [Ruminococcus sp.]|nr:hypothetical protein [Ruminococcus sp.]
MNKAFKIAYASVFLAICATPLILMPFVTGNAEIEKKELTAMPSLIKDGSLNNDFSTEFESWFNDRLPLRSELLSAADFVKSEVFSSPASNVITGSDGWLFFNDEKKDYMDTNALSERQLRSSAVTVSLLEEYVTSRGGRFVFVPMPNKASVYGEYMPSCYTMSRMNNLSRLCAELDKLEVNYVDMKQVLTDNKDQGVYHKRDTHWNYLGALIGYNAIMDKLGADHRTYGGASYEYKKDWRADLDKLLYPSSGFMDYQYHFDIEYQPFRFSAPAGITDEQEALASFMSDKEENDIRITAQNEGDAANERLYMVRDSFGRALLPFMIDNYEKSMFVRADNPDMSMASEGGDMVYEIVERNISRIAAKAPYMFAPEREGFEIPAVGGEVEKTVCTDEGYAVRLYGKLPEGKLTDGRTYVTLTQNGTTRTFEAFPICEKELEGDRGFSMYLSPDLGLEGEYELTVTADGVAYSGGKITV